MTFATIEHALEQLRSGRPVLVLDDEDRENEGDAILAAELASPQWVGWMVRHTSGYLCAPMEDTRADRLGLPLMWSANTASCSSDRATTAACIGRPSKLRHFPSNAVWTLLEITT